MRFPAYTRAAGLVLCVVASTTPGFTAEPGGLKSLDASWEKAMKANDLDAIVALYAPDGVLWMPSSPEARGAAAIRASFQGMLSAYTVQDAVLSDAQYRTAGNVSVGWGHYTLTLAPKAGGAAVTARGRFTGVAERRAGKWLYVSDHASDEPAPSAPAH